MSMKFEMVGKLNIAKDTDKSKAYEVTTFDSGFIRRTLKLNVHSNEDRFNVQIQGGIVGNEEKAEIISLVKKDKGYETVKFKFKDRDKYIGKLAEFKKYIFVDGSDRSEFATAYELAEYMNYLLTKEEYKNKKFKVVGEIDLSQYNDKNTNELKVSKKYNINRIYTVDEDAEEFGKAQVDLLIDENAISDTLIDDDILLIHGYVEQYDSKKKGNIGIQQVFEYSLAGKGDKKDKIVEKMRELMTPKGEDTLSKIGFNLELVNRSEEVEFSIDLITDEEKEALEFGFTTEEQLKKEYGNGKGGYVQKTLISTIKKGFVGGCLDTAIKLEELLLTGEEPKDKVDLTDLGSLDDDEMGDLFGE